MAASSAAALHRKMESLEEENENLKLRLKYIQTIGDVYRSKIHMLLSSGALQTGRGSSWEPSEWEGASPPNKSGFGELSAALHSMGVAESIPVSKHTMLQVISEPLSTADVETYWKDQFLGLVKDSPTMSTRDTLLMKSIVSEKEALSSRVSVLEHEVSSYRSRNEELEMQCAQHSRELHAKVQETAHSIILEIEQEKEQLEQSKQRDFRRKMAAMQAKLARAEDGRSQDVSSLTASLEAAQGEIVQCRNDYAELEAELSRFHGVKLDLQQQVSDGKALLQKEVARSRTLDVQLKSSILAVDENVKNSSQREKMLKDQILQLQREAEELRHDKSAVEKRVHAVERDNLKLSIWQSVSSGGGGSAHHDSAPPDAGVEATGTENILSRLTNAVTSVETQNMSLGGGLKELTAKLDAVDCLQRTADQFKEQSIKLAKQLRVVRDECLRTAKMGVVLNAERLQKLLLVASDETTVLENHREVLVKEKDGFRMMEHSATGDVYYVTSNPFETPFGPRERVLRESGAFAEVIQLSTRKVLYVTEDIDSSPFGAPNDTVSREYLGFQEIMRTSTGETLYQTSCIDSTPFGNPPPTECVLRERDGVSEVEVLSTREKYYRTADIRHTSFHVREVLLRELAGFKELLLDDGRTIYVTEMVDQTPFAVKKSSPVKPKEVIVIRQQSSDKPATPRSRSASVVRTDSPVASLSQAAINAGQLFSHIDDLMSPPERARSITVDEYFL